jgi:hypothetical protein
MDGERKRAGYHRVIPSLRAAWIAAVSSDTPSSLAPNVSTLKMPKFVRTVWLMFDAQELIQHILPGISCHQALS